MFFFLDQVFSIGVRKALFSKYAQQHTKHFFLLKPEIRKIQKGLLNSSLHDNMRSVWILWIKLSSLWSKNIVFSNYAQKHTKQILLLKPKMDRGCGKQKTEGKPRFFWAMLSDWVFAFERVLTWNFLFWDLEISTNQRRNLKKLTIKKIANFTQIFAKNLQKSHKTYRNQRIVPILQKKCNPNPCSFLIILNFALLLGGSDLTFCLTLF